MDAPATQPKDRPETKSGLSLIDCDVHNAYRSPADYRQYLPAYYRKAGGGMPGGHGWVNPVGVSRDDARADDGAPAGSCVKKMREQLLDAYGMDYAILTGGGILSLGVLPDTDLAAAMMRAYNQWTLETWADADPRFRASLVVAPQNPEESAKEIRKLGSHPKLVQVMMCSAARVGFGDRMYWPIYEAACEMGLPVAIHPGTECKGISNVFTTGLPPTYFEWHTNLSQNYMAQLSSLVCRGVFNAFPNLTFVFIEGGFAWLPHLMWRLDKNWKALRSTTPWLDRAPSEYILEHVKLTTQPVEEPEKPEYLLQILDMIHADKTLMFSSDYPHWDNDCPRHGFPVKLPEPLHSRIMWQTASELYGLS